MSKNNPNTEEILDAIKSMMSESSIQDDKELPKDIMELTNPVTENNEDYNDGLDILELSNPIEDDKIPPTDSRSSESYFNEDLISEEQIKKAVRKTIKAFPSSRLDEIINQELEKIIKEKLISSKITISSENKK